MYLYLVSVSIISILIIATQRYPREIDLRDYGSFFIHPSAAMYHAYTQMITLKGILGLLEVSKTSCFTTLKGYFTALKGASIGRNPYKITLKKHKAQTLRYAKNWGEDPLQWKSQSFSGLRLG